MVTQTKQPVKPIPVRVKPIPVKMVKPKLITRILDMTYAIVDRILYVLLGMLLAFVIMAVLKFNGLL